MLDRDSGVVASRTALDLDAIAGQPDAVDLGAALFGSRAGTVVEAMDRYLPALLVVVHGDTLPAEAVDVVKSWAQDAE